MTTPKALVTDKFLVRASARSENGLKAALRTPRRGLAPLELVIALPILLFVMALMVNFATAVCWKVRGSTNARHAAWRARWPRSGDWDGSPATWRPPASMGTGDGERLRQLADPAVQYPVVRGPLPNGFAVHSYLFDQTRGQRVATADKKLAMPMLPKLGRYDLHVEHELLDDGWQYPRMSLPKTIWRRIPTLYTLPQTEQALPAAFIDSVRQLVSAPLHEQLNPLDQDDEFLAFYGGCPDFHPDLRHFCGLMEDDAPEIERLIEDLIHRIQGHCTRSGDQVRVTHRGVPGHMTASFLNMYRTQLAQVQTQIPPRPGMFGQVGQLERKIEQLERFSLLIDELIKQDCERENPR